MMPRQTENHQTKPAGVPAATFTLFGNLPPELSLLIWEEFARTPRIIRAGQAELDKKDREGQFSIKVNGLVREQACPLLGVCRASRSVAIKAGMLLFTLGSRDYPGAPCHNRHFAIRNCDIMYFGDHKPNYGTIIPQGEADKISNIMLSADVRAIYGGTWSSESIWANWLEFGYLGLHITKCLGSTQNLKRIYGLIHDKKNTAVSKPFEMDGLGGLAPCSPPEYRRGLADWMRYSSLEQKDWELLYKPTTHPHLLMFHPELARWINSGEVIPRPRE